MEEKYGETDEKQLFLPEQASSKSGLMDEQDEKQKDNSQSLHFQFKMPGKIMMIYI